MLQTEFELKHNVGETTNRSLAEVSIFDELQTQRNREKEKIRL